MRKLTDLGEGREKDKELLWLNSFTHKKRYKKMNYCNMHTTQTECKHNKKVKVKLSLCLTKHHAMKAYCGNGSIAPCSL
jgi:hypothetical protein